ncbi:lipoate--protein ligase family protein [Companilactobacillus sp.]|uniref:lipoate--protein ligase family protein n=1 Tax=Companilactobacillus sp. TaxID=2767905 RepID=UPI0025B8558D|nr:lipoate--protein ligase family protein [Companilactobacillus sp.]MCH4010119.1 lipoate--protein ligase family protein [Companilactobacillus sp.]MCH4052205.1 lipoate--protein ligase family protein [Companilactobacillus sp.]MCH4078061.1 lipoate--protein ligase family protein [Companilactobacillus sp.]MCH4126637.1 lipoate--protein ligase family protein [Companilactobacillus sp.]MCH4132222.1 lipoate--protein ligase family protein [Companilactobacillus sp.]
MNKQILLYDQNLSKAEQMLEPFADTGAILQFVSEEKTPVAHFWTTTPTVILGLQDQRLKNLSGGLKMLEEKEYIYYLRNSGGLGVVTDPEILNFTLFLPNKDELSIDQAYEKMHQIMMAAFSDKIETGEVVRSYCPGTFDLSIDGKKLAGISQRRSGDAVAVMAYISITGDQKQRSQLMKDFYEISNYPVHEKISYPNIDIHCMENLDILTHQELTISLAKEKILNALITDDYSIDKTSFNIVQTSQPYREAYDKTMEDLIYKNKQLGEKNDI